MATINGTSGSDSILPSGVSAGVTGGLPGANNDTVFGTRGNDTIDGGGGNNTLDYSGYTLQININYTSFGAGNVAKFFGETDVFSNFVYLYAGSGNDFLLGTGASGPVSIWLRGNAGNDSINGVSSRNVAADYRNSPAAINVNLSTGVAQDGWGSTDTLIDVRRINGSAYADSITGGAFGEVFYFAGGPANRVIDGGGATDRGNEVRYSFPGGPLFVDLAVSPAAGGGYNGIVTGSSGVSDSLVRVTRAVGSDGADTMLGTMGDDVLEGEAGADVLNGRSGFDFVGFSSVTSTFPTVGATANLTTGTATDPWGGTDVLIGIEGVFGGGLADDFTGVNLGFATRSLLQGNGGADTLRGAAGGFSAADYNNDGAGVTVNLAAGTATDGGGATDTLIGINAVRGSSGFGDNITGSSGDDWLAGGGGGDVMAGGSGADRVFGEDGNDTLDGGEGNDQVYGFTGQDSMTGGAGADRFTFNITDVPGAHSSRAVQDVITDFSVAEGDSLRFGVANSLLIDVWYAGQVGTAYTLLNVDIPLPGWAAPAGINPYPVFYIPHTSQGGWVVVDENRDGVLQSNEFAVRLRSTITDPSQIKMAGAAFATAGLIGDNTNNTIFIDAGFSGAGARGLGGDDVIYGGGGFDNMAGGLGNDQYVVRNRDTVLVELANEGDDTAYFTVSDATNGANIEIGRLAENADLLRGSATAEQLVANISISSTLYGNGGDDTLWSSALADLLDGGDGDDIIRGQGGADTMYGGLGNDQFVVFSPTAQVIEYLNGGYDTVYVASASFTMGPNIEVGRLGAVGAVALYGSGSSESLVANPGEASTLEGNGGDDALYGAAFNDTLRGGAGNDILVGNGGNDVLVGGTGNDSYVMISAGTIVELAGEGYDILYFAGTGSFSTSASIEEVRLSGSATSYAYTGSALNKLLVGNNAGLASNLNGGAGDDIIYGTAAADTLLGGTGNDTIYTQGGADRLYYGITGFGFDQVAGFDQVGGAKLQFLSGSGITSFAQVSLNVAGGNTQVNTSAGSILVFGVTLTQSDFIFS